MKSKGISILKIIIIIVIFLVVLGGIGLYLYQTTDFLKSNTQLFFKYLGQVVDEENGFIDNQLIEYQAKKNTSKYEDNGKFYVDINTPELNSDMLKIVNDFNIEYKGKTDNTAIKTEQQISLNYSNDVNLPIKYKYANNVFGLQTDYVSSKYIGLENKELAGLIQKIGVTAVENFPDQVDINQYLTENLTIEQQEQIEDTYKTILREKIKEKNFTKTKENDIVSYSVEITNEELKDLLIEVLETLKNDELLLPKIENVEKWMYMFNLNGEETEEDMSMSDKIQAYIDEIKESEIEEGTSKITVSQKDGKLTGLSLKIIDNEVKFTKTKDQQTLTYNMEMNIKDTETDDVVNLFMIENFQGLEQQSVNETYQTGIKYTIDGQEYKKIYNLNCTNTFKDDLSIEDYNDGEIQTLNDYEGTKILSLIMQIADRIEAVNQKQMEEIGFLEYGNPMEYIFSMNLFDDDIDTNV